MRKLQWNIVVPSTDSQTTTDQQQQRQTVATRAPARTCRPTAASCDSTTFTDSSLQGATATIIDAVGRIQRAVLQQLDEKLSTSSSAAQRAEESTAISTTSPSPRGKKKSSDGTPSLPRPTTAAAPAALDLEGLHRSEVAQQVEGQTGTCSDPAADWASSTSAAEGMSADASSRQQLPRPTSVARFSIDDILRPDFGRSRHSVGCSRVNFQLLQTADTQTQRSIRPLLLRRNSGFAEAYHPHRAADHEENTSSLDSSTATTSNSFEDNDCPRKNSTDALMTSSYSSSSPSTSNSSSGACCSTAPMDHQPSGSSQFAARRPLLLPVSSAAPAGNGFIQTTVDPRLPAWIYCTRYSDRPSAG